MQDFTSVEQLFDKNQPPLPNPERKSLFHSLKQKFLNKKQVMNLKKMKQDGLGQKPSKRLKTWQKILLIILILFFISIISLLTYSYLRLKNMMSLANSAKIQAMESLDLLKNQNLPALPEKVQILQESLASLDGEYQSLKIYQHLPFVKAYYHDGQTVFLLAHKALDLAEQVVEDILPYSELLGFAGEGSFEGGTTQDRIVLILQTIEEIQPTIENIEEKLQEIVDVSQTIDANRYPEQISNHPVRQEIIKIQEQITEVVHTFSDYRPIMSELAKMAGAEEAQKYLILFQNDNELRPTGGFLTAYSIVKVDKGRVIPEKSGDIYDLDLKFRQNTAIPKELGRYLTTERYWHLRDMNIYPDFKKSMETFYQNYQTIPSEPDDIDGIIAVDTQLLTWLLEVIGPVQVAGYGTFSAEVDKRCDCPQVVYALSEIITRPTPYLREDRKGVLGPLMSGILSKTYELDKSRFPELINVALNSMKARHVQLYFVDEQSQIAAEKIRAAGRLYQLDNNFKNWQFGQNQDFLAIVNTNLGGAKSNLFINHDLKISVTAPENNYITNTVEITYRNSAKADNCNLEAGQLCLNATLNDWIRLYLPPNSELIEIQGLEDQEEVYEEEGYTVIDGFFKLEPLGLAKIRLSYKVPYQDQENYNLRLWKQGGIDPVPVLIDVTGGEEELLMDQDLNYSTVF